MKSFPGLASLEINAHPVLWIAVGVKHVSESLQQSKL